MEKIQKQKIQQSVGEVEEQWRSLLQAAAEVLNQAQTEADAQKQFDASKSRIEKVQMWIKDQEEKLLSASSHVQFEERMQAVQVGVKVQADASLDGPAASFQLCFHCPGCSGQQS